MLEELCDLLLDDPILRAAPNNEIKSLLREF